MENIKIFACKSAEKFTKEICDYLNLPVGEIIDLTKTLEITLATE